MLFYLTVSIINYYCSPVLRRMKLRLRKAGLIAYDPTVRGGGGGDRERELGWRHGRGAGSGEQDHGMRFLGPGTLLPFSIKNIQAYIL